MDRARIDGIELEYEVAGAGSRSCSSTPASAPTSSRRLSRSALSPAATPCSATTAAATRGATACRCGHHGAPGGALPGADAPPRDRARARRRAFLEREHGAPAGAGRLRGRAVPRPARSGRPAVPARPDGIGPQRSSSLRSSATVPATRRALSTSGCAASAGPTTAPRSSGRSPVLSTRPSPTRTRSSDRNCRRWRNGHSARRRRARIAQAALVVLGENSIPLFRERCDLLLAWLPERRGLRASRGDAPAPRAESRRHGKRPGRVLLTPPAPCVSHTQGARPLARPTSTASALRLRLRATPASDIATGVVPARPLSSGWERGVSTEVLRTPAQDESRQRLGGTINPHAAVALRHKGGTGAARRNASNQANARVTRLLRQQRGQRRMLGPGEEGWHMLAQSWWPPSTPASW